LEISAGGNDRRANVGSDLGVADATDANNLVDILPRLFFMQ